MVQTKEAVSFYTHLAGAPAFAAAAVFLSAKSFGDTGLFLSMLAYGVSAVFLFSASALYHAMKKREDEKSFYRKLDHLAIFFMIAGTYTPLCWAYLDGWWRAGILLAQWGLVLFGLFFKFFYLSAPRYLSVGVYVLMGWLAVIPAGQFYRALPADMMALILLGGLSYTAGALIYGFKRPDPLPGRFGFHEIFHVLILAGAALHFGAIASIPV